MLSEKGIDMLVNLLTIAYAVMKILSWQNPSFATLKEASPQEARSAIGRAIRRKMFFADLNLRARKSKKSPEVCGAIQEAMDDLQDAA